MTELEKITHGTFGYYECNREDEFPWSASGKHVWYSLQVVIDGKIKHFGFTSSKTQKDALVQALKEVKDKEATLYGVWNGQWSTSLFVLDIEKSIEKLDKL